MTIKQLESDNELMGNRTDAYLVVCVQMAVTAVVAGLLLVTMGKVAAYSALLGGAACIGPTSLFARCAFRYSAAQSPTRVLKWFIIGEFGKLAVTALIFFACIKYVSPLETSVMFLTFLIVVATNLIGLALLNHRRAITDN